MSTDGTQSWWVNVYEKEISPDLTLIVDKSLCIVLVSGRPRHTITNVRRFQALLDEAVVAATVAADQAEAARLAEQWGKQ